MIFFGTGNEYKVIKSALEGDNSHICEIIRFAETNGLGGNILQKYIAYMIASDENIFSISCERRGCSESSLVRCAEADIVKLRQMFDSSEVQLNEQLVVLQDYVPENKVLTDLGKTVSEFANSLARAEKYKDFFDSVVDFYRDNGVGIFGLNKAFYLTDNREICAVSNFKAVLLDDLYGYDYQKNLLTENTKAFVSCRQANNVLLYGDSGTGKSTSVKAVLNEYCKDGLRMIQIQKHQFADLNWLMSIIRNRRYRFIVYLDDLSFDENETEYKYLKAAIEGGFEEKPENMLVYATSNRRHLIKENWDERDGNDVHRNESIQEKVSLSERFGLSINYSNPYQHEYIEIVKHLMVKEGVNIDEQEAIKRAKSWAVLHGGFSGRIAEQFVKDLKAKQG
ncbi:MAG: ATP-binding protein [bacterium]|nr:ATP-binding protein [bacterium]